MDFTNKIGSNILSLILEDKLDLAEEPKKSRNKPSRVYVRDAKAMAATPADVIEYPDAYVFVVDMPGIKPGEIKVQVDDGAVLVVRGERKRGKDKDNKEGVKYVRMERVGELERKFSLTKYANKDAVSAVCWDGVLTVRVEKLPPPEPKRPKTIEVKADVKLLPKPSRVYVRDAKAMAATPADVIEYPDAYVFVVDMPGIKPGEIKVQVDDGAVLMVSGERKMGKDKDNKDGVKYVRMERVGKLERKFSLTKYANKDAVSAVCWDGVLTVRVEKLPPPEPKRPKTIEIKADVKLLPLEPNRPRTIELKAYVKLPPLEPKRPKTIEVKVA